MTGKTHVAIGVATALTLSLDKSPENLIILVLASSLGSLFPDLDHPKAKLNQILLKKNNNFYRILFYISLSGFFIYLYYLKNAALFLLLCLVSFFLGVSNHRGFSHSILGFLISIYIVKMISLKYNLPILLQGFSIGYALHLVGDFFTPMGIKLFYPLNIYVSSPITFKTKGKVEWIIFMVVNFYCVFLLLEYVITK